MNEVSKKQGNVIFVKNERFVTAVFNTHGAKSQVDFWQARIHRTILGRLFKNGFLSVKCHGYSLEYSKDAEFAFWFVYGVRLSKEIRKLLYGRKLAGVAKCHENDVFDEEKGKDIARKDLYARYNRAVDSIYNIILKKVRKQSRRTCDCGK